LKWENRRWEEYLKRREETSRERELRGERTLTLFYTSGSGIVVLHVRVPQPYSFSL
jgi:hypothetical protein